MRTLIIVESPAKARPLGNLLSKTAKHRQAPANRHIRREREQTALLRHRLSRCFYQP
jgi:hypothetical protein